MLEQINIIEQCKRYKIRLWECPQILFLLMGGIIIATMLMANSIAQRHADPEVAALIVIATTGILFVISHVIVRSYERMAESTRVKSDFISIISHQLRSPLSSIRWQLELLLRNPNLDANARSYITNVYEYNNRIGKLVNNLLMVNHIESDRLLPTPTNLSLAAITQKIIKDSEPLAREHDISIKYAAPAAAIPIQADEKYISWAIENLLRNAIQYGKPGTTTTIAINKKDGQVQWNVTNRGTSIKPDDAEHMFEKFFRASSSRQKNKDGSGLGLFITKSVIEASGGSVGFSSKKSGATTFWFILPLASTS